MKKFLNKLGRGGWGMDSLIGFMIGFAIFLLIIVVLTYKYGL